MEQTDHTQEKPLMLFARTSEGKLFVSAEDVASFIYEHASTEAAEEFCQRAKKADELMDQEKAKGTIYTSTWTARPKSCLEMYVETYNEINRLWKAIAITAIVMTLGFAVILWKIV